MEPLPGAVLITIPRDDQLTTELWDALLEVSVAIPKDWTLVGAQMVFLHGLEHHRAPPRRTTDFDVIVNVRAVADQPKVFVRGLESLGYQLEGVSADGIGHRFVRDAVKIDVLLPDGIGKRASREVAPGVRSVEVPGGSQALHRSVRVRVRTDKRVGDVPRPSLLGAILVKARAVAVDDLADAQREDLAFLLSLVEDPFAMADELSRNERRWLDRQNSLLDPDARAWRRIDDAEDGRAALRILLGAG